MVRSYNRIFIVDYDINILVIFIIQHLFLYIYYLPFYIKIYYDCILIA